MTTSLFFRTQKEAKPARLEHPLLPQCLQSQVASWAVSMLLSRANLSSHPPMQHSRDARQTSSTAKRMRRARNHHQAAPKIPQELMRFRSIDQLSMKTATASRLFRYKR